MSIKYYDFVTVTCPPNRKCIDRVVESIFYETADNKFIFEIQKTYRDISRWKFPLTPGCTITCELGKFLCTNVSYKENRPRFAVCETIKNA